MTEQLANIAHEAKSLCNTLKELLKTKEPYDREVDAQRKNLRRHYLNLLLVYPCEKESKDVENHLWMMTSYSLIASYKTRIAALDRALMMQNEQREQQRRQTAQPQTQNHHDGQASQRKNLHHGVVEYRKLVQRFRQFLAEEEKFWTLLVQRMYRTFGLTEARASLTELGLLADLDEDVNTQPDAEGNETGQLIGRTSNGRNHYQFPPENPSSLLSTPSSQVSHLATFSKALVCLGDIARYRELYNDSQGRPRAGHESITPAKRRNRKGQEIVPRARNYDKAQKCYDQARLLVPNEGNPWHQLAILSSYQKNTFLMVMHYYRALCVQQPYETATDNLNMVLTRVLDTWKKYDQQEREKTLDIEMATHMLVNTFQERIITLHALWRLGAERGAEKMDSIGAKLDQLIHHDFNMLVSGRKLSEDTITQIIVLSEGAFYKHRMIRPKTDRQPPENTPILLDWRIIQHIYDLHSTLLSVGIAELAVPPPSDVDVGNDDKLALKITATFRRTLPGLRIAGKWLRANNGTLMKDPEYIAISEEKGSGVKVSKEHPDKISKSSVKTIEFWSHYVDFICALMEAFPKSNLPALTSPLDEDIDMRGFLPLKKLIGTQNATGVQTTSEKPHPNAEHLMRIHDLLDDARILAELPNSLVKLESGRLVLNYGLIEERRTSSHPDRGPESDHDDSATTATSVTDDDVIEEAIRARDNRVLEDDYDDDDDDDDEEIVYLQSTPSPVLKPMQSPPSRGSIVPITASTVPAQIQTINSSTTLSPKSPTQLLRSAIQPQTAHASVAPHATTAEDLLKDVMLGLKASDSTSQSRFLQSIWSASSDEQPLKFAAGSPPKNVYQSSQQYQTGIPQSWSSSFNSTTVQPAQHGPLGSMQNPQTLVSSQHASMTPGFHNQYQHQRLSSLTSSPHQRYPVLNQSELQEPLMFSRFSQQQLPFLHPTDMGPLAPLSMSSSNTVHNPLLNNVIGAASTSQAPGPYSSPFINGSTSHHTSGGLSLSPQGHTRQVTFGQSNHSSQSQTTRPPVRPPVLAQSFASMHQTW